jgi:hypothetical protein
MYFAGLGVADPEFDGIGSEVDEGKSFSVGGPQRPARACRLGEGNVNLFAVGNVNEFEVRGAESDAVAAGSIVLAVIPGLNADASEAQEGRRYAGD